MNQEPHTRACNRREFLAQLGRYGILAAMGYLLVRTLSAKRNPVDESPCTRRGICRGCPSLPACKLPQSLSFKQKINHER